MSDLQGDIDRILALPEADAHAALGRLQDRVGADVLRQAVETHLQTVDAHFLSAVLTEIRSSARQDGIAILAFGVATFFNLYCWRGIAAAIPLPHLAQTMAPAALITANLLCLAYCLRKWTRKRRIAAYLQRHGLARIHAQWLRHP